MEYHDFLKLATLAYIEGFSKDDNDTVGDFVMYINIYSSIFKKGLFKK